MPGSTPGPAVMGFIGAIKIGNLDVVRATRGSLTAKQAIDHPDVVDGGVDWTLYQLKGIEIDGDVEIPVVGGTFTQQLLSLLKRNVTGDGQMVLPSDVSISYGKALVRTFKDCFVNTLELRATAGERLDTTVNFWGTRFDTGGGSLGGPTDGVRRVLSWADISINGPSVNSCDVRALTLTINNNLSRNYTFCDKPGIEGFFPNNISAGKRNVSGNLEFQGPAPTEDLAFANSNTTTPNGGDLTLATTDGLAVVLHNIVYEFQSIEAQPGLITSTVNWYAHAPAGDEAITF